mgnify:CR=1 FL=1
MVGTGGFEPPTPCTPSMCATRLRHAPGMGSLPRNRRGRLDAGSRPSTRSREAALSPGHLVAWDASLNYSIGKSGAGWISLDYATKV